MQSRSWFMSLEFKIDRKTTGFIIRLWKGSQFVKMCVMRCGRGMPLAKSHLGTIANLLGTVFEKPGFVSCECVGVDVLKPLEKMPSSKVCLQYHFSIHGLFGLQMDAKYPVFVQGLLRFCRDSNFWSIRISWVFGTRLLKKKFWLSINYS